MHGGQMHYYTGAKLAGVLGGGKQISDKKIPSTANFLQKTSLNLAISQHFLQKKT